MSCNGKCKTEKVELKINGNKKIPTYRVEGGIGKHIAFSSLITKLSKKDGKKINLISAYPDLFADHPKVSNSFSFEQYELNKNKISKVVSNIHMYEPYKGTFAFGTTHLLQDWSNAYGIDWSQKDLPEIFVSNEIKDEVKKIATELGDFILTQFTGGQPPLEFNPQAQYQNNMMQQQRNYPFGMAQHLVLKIKEENPDLKIIDFSLPNEHQLIQGTQRLELPYIYYVELLKYAKTFVGVDSSLAHMAAASNKKGVVLWGGIPAYKFGWDLHINLSNYNQQGPFNENDAFYIAVDYNFVNSKISELL